MVKLKILKKFVIGETDIEKIDDAVKMEYEEGIRPLVSEKLDRYSTMERYASLLVIHSVSASKVGKMEFCLDGCKSDLMFSVEDNKYLGIQVKTTKGLKSMKRGDGSLRKGWFFSDVEGYPGLLMYFRSLIDGKSWLIPYNLLRQYYKSYNLRIPVSKNTKLNWDDYEINDTQLGQMIYEYYKVSINNNDLLVLKDYKNINKAVSKNVQKEYNQRDRILPILEKTGLKIEQPKFENMVYDIILGELRIQEKSSRQKLKYGLYVNFNGRNHRKYKETDFDILIVHNPSPFDHTFYFIPMDKLAEHGFVKTETQEGNSNLFLYTGEVEKDKKSEQSNKNNWALDFLCYYSDPNLTKRLIFIYNMQLYHDMKPVVIKDHIFWDINPKNLNDLVNKFNLERSHALSNDSYNFKLYDRRILEKTITKNSDRKLVLYMYISINRKRFPHNEGEFDFIYSKIPEYEGFYLIPSSELIKRKILKNETSEGQKSISIPFPGTNVKIPSQSNLWVNEFIFFYNDKDFKNTLLNFFEKYK